MVTNLYQSDNKRDNEQRSFRADSNGDSARNIVSADLLAGLSPLLGALKYDSGTVNYPNTLTEIYQFRQGGIVGTIVATITLIYLAENKKDLSSWSAVVI